MWSNAKEALRCIAARTVATVGEAVTRAMATITAADCRGYFTHRGYAP